MNRLWDLEITVGFEDKQDEKIVGTGDEQDDNIF